MLTKRPACLQVGLSEASNHWPTVLLVCSRPFYYYLLISFLSYKNRNINIYFAELLGVKGNHHLTHHI